jgi:hypothetical protein
MNSRTEAGAGTGLVFAMYNSMDISINNHSLYTLLYASLY